MITLRTTAQVDEKGQLNIRLPESLLPGECKLVIVIDEKL
jgi:hypothetical protein